jgi:hypothetical protein
MAYCIPRTPVDDVSRQWPGANEPPPPIARVARNRGLTPLQTYLRLLETGRIDLNNEVKQLKITP